MFVSHSLIIVFLFQVHIENKQSALAAALCIELGNALKVNGTVFCLTKQFNFHTE